MRRHSLTRGRVSGGYWALFRFKLPACYHPNLGIFWGVWLFKKFFCQKIYPTPIKSLFENTMGNQFFDFFKYWPNRFEFFFWMDIWTFSFPIRFCNQFWTSGCGQTENTQYLKKTKNGFPIVFSKIDLTGVGYIFWQFSLKKLNNPKYA